MPSVRTHVTSMCAFTSVYVYIMYWHSVWMYVRSFQNEFVNNVRMREQDRRFYVIHFAYLVFTFRNVVVVAVDGLFLKKAFDTNAHTNFVRRRTKDLPIWRLLAVADLGESLRLIIDSGPWQILCRQYLKRIVCYNSYA